jgi:iron complex outermembrane recepter protein
MNKNNIPKIGFALILFGCWPSSLWATLSSDSTIEKHLKEVEISEKKTILTLSEFKILTINEKPYFSNLTTASALQQIPSLNADIEGNLRLRGSSKVCLLYEGIPITLFEENRADLLIQLPVALFSSILTYNMLPVDMTNEGEAGAVDFIFSPAFSGTPVCKVNVGAGSNQRYNASLLAGARTGKFRWQLGYDYRQEYRYRTYQKTTTDNTGIARMSNRAAAWPRTHLVMVNAQYLINPSDFIDFNMLLCRLDYNRLGNISNAKTNPAGVQIANVLRQRNNTEKQSGTSEGIKWKHLWKEQQADFEAVVNYDDFDYHQANQYANKKPGTETILAQDRLFITQKKHQWFASACLSKQVTQNVSGQIGYTGQWHTDHYTASDDDLTNAVWKPNTAKSTDYSLIRNLQYGFAEAIYKTGRMRCALGMQAQFDTRRVDQPVDIPSTEINNFYLLPHVEITYRNSSFSSWILRYQERINRPLLADLNPFIDNSDATYIHQGNPALSNEKVRTAELSNTARTQELTVNSALFYRYRYNQLVDVATVTGSSTIWTKENANHAQDVGLELNLQWNPVVFVTAATSVTAYRYKIDGTRQGYGIKGKNAVDGKESLSFRLPNGFHWEMYGYYTDRQLTVQGEIAAVGSVGSALSWTGLNGRMNVALSIDNIFNSIEEKTTLNTSGTQQEIYRNRDARTVWLSAGYRL